ncbi:iron-containing alcohol dehydrogenase family protein [Streptomyces sp. AD55]|uniref:iron-containing alcohol dehydrogenase family protein n=1 Tax=Streptomyces sp. AD55 TaxID=3242895 RepID=UPI0035295C4C
MPVLSRLIPSPVAVHIRRGALDDLPDLLVDQRIAPSGRVAVAVSGGSGTALRRRLAPALPGAAWFETRGAGLDDAVRLADRTRTGRHDAIVGIGGGRVIDCAKFAAARLGLPMVTVATSLSHDGICSPVSVLANDAGHGSYGVPAPVALLVDLAVVRRAPPRYVRSGIGDALSNLSAVADWELAHRVRGERVDGLAAALARQAGENVLRHPGGCDDDAFLTVLAEGLVLSGVAMTTAGHSRPASGACHEIGHALDLLHPRHPACHGEQVGMAAAFATHLRGDTGRARLVARTLRRHGLPVLARELGVGDDDFVRAVAFAPRTRPGRYTILEHLDLTPERIAHAYAEYAASVTGPHGPV